MNPEFTDMGRAQSRPMLNFNKGTQMIFDDLFYPDNPKKRQEVAKLPIPSALIPDFYQNFHRLTQNCRDSCCVGAVEKLCFAVQFIQLLSLCFGSGLQGGCHKRASVPYDRHGQQGHSAQP